MAVDNAANATVFVEIEQPPLPYVPIVIASNLPYGVEPVNVTCPYCHIQCETVVKKKLGSCPLWNAIACLCCSVCLLAVLGPLLLCCAPCLCLCFPQKREHYCPNCKICLAIVEPVESKGCCGLLLQGCRRLCSCCLRDPMEGPKTYTIPE